MMSARRRDTHVAGGAVSRRLGRLTRRVGGAASRELCRPTRKAATTTATRRSACNTVQGSGRGGGVPLRRGDARDARMVTRGGRLHERLRARGESARPLIMLIGGIRRRLVMRSARRCLMWAHPIKLLTLARAKWIVGEIGMWVHPIKILARP
jgi:hypothetical protein